MSTGIIRSFIAGAAVAAVAAIICYELPNDTPPAEVKYVKVRDYSRLTTATCRTDEECKIATARQFYIDNGWVDEMESIPLLEPVECEDGDKQCEEDNRRNAGKPARYPALCEPFIFAAPPAPVKP